MRKLAEKRLKELGFVRNNRKHREFNRRIDDGAVVLTVELPHGSNCSIEDIQKSMARLKMPGFDVKKFMDGGYSDCELEVCVSVRGAEVSYV